MSENPNKIFYEEGNPLHVRASLGSPGFFNIGGALKGDDYLGDTIKMRVLAFEQFTGVMFPSFNEGETAADKQREKFELYYINEVGLVCCLLVGGSYSPSEFRQQVMRVRLNPKTGALCKFTELSVTATIVPKEKGNQKFSIIKFAVEIATPEDTQEREAFLANGKVFSYEMMAEKLRWSAFYKFSRAINVFDVYNNPLTIESNQDTNLQIGNE